MNLHFTISEYNKTGEPIPEEVADKILLHHISPMNAVREDLGAPVRVSLNSGYRPRSYELKMGRSGKSQHCFIGYGAADYTADNIEGLLRLIIKKTAYTRICYYPNNKFIHCDYKVVGERQYFEAENPTSRWDFIKKI